MQRTPRYKNVQRYGHLAFVRDSTYVSSKIDAKMYRQFIRYRPIVIDQASSKILELGPRDRFRNNFRSRESANVWKKIADRFRFQPRLKNHGESLESDRFLFRRAAPRWEFQGKRVTPKEQKPGVRGQQRRVSFRKIDEEKP